MRHCYNRVNYKLFRLNKCMRVFQEFTVANLPKDLSSLKLYLDMDGVISNFIDNYLALADKIGIKYVGCKTANHNNPELFRTAVLDHQIFKNLSMMPFAHELLSYVCEIQSETGLQVEMLTSVNSLEPEVIKAASDQKQDWLNKRNINWKANFVSTNIAKASYANNTTLLIDDMDYCIEPFAQNGGNVLKFIYFDEFFTRHLCRILQAMHDHNLRKAC